MNRRKVRPDSSPRIASSRLQDSSGLANSSRTILVHNSGINQDSNINTVTSLASRAILRLRMRKAARTRTASSGARPKA